MLRSCSSNQCCTAATQTTCVRGGGHGVSGPQTSSSFACSYCFPSVTSGSPRETELWWTGAENDWERCVHACVHACVRACMRACVRACVCTCVRVYVHVCVCVCIRGYVRGCVCVRACMHARTGARTHGATVPLYEDLFGIEVIDVLHMGKMQQPDITHTYAPSSLVLGCMINLRYKR